MREICWLVALLAGFLCGCGVGPSRDGPRGGPAEVARPEAAANAESQEVAVQEPSPSEPVTAVLWTRPASVAAGDAVEVLVAVRIARAHYLHATGGPGGKFTPLGIDLALPPGVEAAGAWEFPAAAIGPAGAPEYRDAVFLKRSLVVSPTVPPGSIDLRGELRYQACTEELCWPPGRMPLSAPLLVQTPPR